MINHSKYISNTKIILKVLIFLTNIYLFKNVDKEVYAFFFFQLFLLKKLLMMLYQNLFKKENFLINKYLLLNKNNKKTRSIILLIYMLIMLWLWYNLVTVSNKIYNEDYICFFLIYTLILIEILIKNYRKLYFYCLSKWTYLLENDILLLCQNGITFIILFFKLLRQPYSIIIGHLIGYLLHFFVLKIIQVISNFFYQNHFYHDDSNYWIKEKYFNDNNINNKPNNQKTFFFAKCLILFANSISLNEQAILTIIECFGNLLAEILFEPTIKIGTKFISIYSYNDKTINDDEVKNFKNVFKPFILFGLILGLFFAPYSYLIAKLIGDDFLINNQGVKLLTFYFIYLILLSINCILEHFISLVLKKSENNIFKKYYYLIIGITIIVYYTIYQYKKNIGLCAANIFVTIIHIIYNLNQIYSIEKRLLTPISNFFPSLNSTILLIFGYLTTQLSFIIFAKSEGILNNLTHLSIGGIMFIVIIFQFVQNEFPKYNSIIFFHEKLYY